MMPWYGLRQADGSYTVVEAADATDFTITYNANPEQEGVPGQTTSGFPNQLLAQNAVNQAQAGSGGGGTTRPADITIPKPLVPLEPVSPGLGLLGGLKNFFSGVTDATGAIEGLAATFAAFFSAVFDVTTWRSLFWFWVGLNLITAGIIWWSLGDVLAIVKKVL